jgi:PAS domain-containing protein
MIRSMAGAGNRSMLWQEDLPWLYGSDYFHEIISGLRAFDVLWGCAPARNSRYPVLLSLYHDRRQRGARFGAKDVQLMRLLRPALEAGVQTILRMAASRASLAASLDQQDDGTLVYDLEGRLLHRNPAMRVLEELSISPHTARHHTEAVMGKLRVDDRRDVERRIREAGHPN